MAKLGYSNPAWNSNGNTGAGLSYDGYSGGYDIWDAQTSAQGGGFSLGTLVNSITGGGGTTFMPTQQNGVNTTQLDGQRSFFEGLAGFSTALLSGIGVGGDNPRGAQPASWGRPQPQGIGVGQIAVFGLIGAGVYFAFKKK